MSKSIRNPKPRKTNPAVRTQNMKNKPESESKKLLCPKACVLNQLDDDRHSDTIVLETQKAIDATPTLRNHDR